MQEDKMTIGDETPLAALVRKLYANPLSGKEIEAKSFEAIDREAGSHGFGEKEWQVVRRMIHTSADFSIAGDVCFLEGALNAGATALSQGRAIYVDSNMMRAGISLARLREVSGRYGAESIICHVADPDVAAAANEAGLPRAIFAVRKAAPMIDGAVVCFGNSPAGLLELNRLIMEEDIRPALVIAMPVGFVHVEESKNELMGLRVPAIVLKGRRGGSALAVSVIHALCSISKESVL
jgi:precorrin-8X/cobalt-precorrin-8 methylmutase